MGILYLLAAHLFSAAQATADDSYKQWFQEANRLYYLNNPTTDSDERALGLYLRVAAAAAAAPEEVRIKSLINGGNIHQGYERYNESNRLYHRAIALAGHSHAGLLYEAYLYIGSSMYFNRVMDSATHYFELSAAILEKHPNSNSLPERSRLYNSLGGIYYEAANYQQALNYFRQALNLADKRSVDFGETYTAIQINIAKCLFKQNRFGEGIAILRKLKPSAAQASLVQQSIARGLMDSGDYRNALSVYLKAGNLPGFYGIIGYNDIGSIYLKLSMRAQARQFFEKAISENNQLSGGAKNKERAQSYLYLSKLAQEQGNLPEALRLSQKALEEIHLRFKPKKLLDLPQDISGSVSPIVLYKVLTDRAHLCRTAYARTQDTGYLFASLRAYRKAFETAGFISRNLDNDDARLFFLGNTKHDYEDAVDMAYQALQHQQAAMADLMWILESYKGNILRQNLAFAELKKKAGIPDSLIEKENALKRLYAGFLTKLNTTTNTAESEQLQKRVSAVQVELSRLQRSYEDNTLYKWIKKSADDPGISMAQLQNSLDGKTALLNYFVATNDIYLLVITGHTVQVYKMPHSPVYKTALASFKEETLRMHEGFRYKGYYASYQLFKTLLEPAYPLLRKYKKLVVIPDEHLFMIPFDALCIADYAKHYLLQNHIVSYHYSFSLLYQKMQTGVLPFASSSVLAFAPFSKKVNNNSAVNALYLPLSAQEIAYAHARKVLGSDASLMHFLKAYNQFSVLHLATHASMGQDSSTNFIQFYPHSGNLSESRLYVHDIYNLRLSESRLVILSACESAAGLSAKGEGVLSLSRAFMYAGASGIISTLYKTDDRVTAFLMGRLMHYLQSGQDTETALALSKRDLLESNEINERLKAPNYWSNFIYTGAVTTKKDSTLFRILSLSMLAIVVIFFAWFVGKKLFKPLHS